MCRRIVVVLAMFPLTLVLAASASAQTTARIGGTGSTGLGGLNLTLAAVQVPNGKATGFSRLDGGATGAVVQIVPPFPGSDSWCINVKRTDVGILSGDQRINWYIRDIGDGKTTFDEISYVTSIGGDCTRFPVSLGVFLPLVEGDFNSMLPH